MSTLAGCCVNLQTLCDISLAVFNGGVSMVIFCGPQFNEMIQVVTLVWDICSSNTCAPDLFFFFLSPLQPLVFVNSPLCGAKLNEIPD